MNQPVIRVENLGKKYTLGHQVEGGTLRDRLAGIFNPKSQIANRKSEEFWALRDVSFEVNQGEVVGIIGRNGAGKSTLLKILSRITEPTTGKITLEGRVASLLEVGTGFHPELSGRENIFLNGAILGMTRQEIRRKFDEIVAFAEIERFLDTPVKRYSSGMYVRLAFAVAAHLDPEILIVDEVLAVGDTEFQKKCLGKMHDVARGHGRTVLFVSHNLAAIRSLCSRSAYLVGGQLEAYGDTGLTLDKYTQTGAHAESRLFKSRDLFPGLRIQHLVFTPEPATSEAPLDFSITVTADRDMPISDLCLIINASEGARVAILDLRTSRELRTLSASQPLTICGHIPSLNLIEGNYSIAIFAASADQRVDLPELYPLQVLPSAHSRDYIPYSPRDRGIVEIPFSLT